MSGSPFVWMGSTTVGTSNVIRDGVEPALEDCASTVGLPALTKNAKTNPTSRALHKRAISDLLKIDYN
jgi:hypothetical protein